MFKKFKEFALSGNVLDMAVGVIMGGAIGKVVASLVENILMPIIGIPLGEVSFNEWVIPVLGAKIKLGMFVQEIISFLIIALSIFLMLQAIEKAGNIAGDKKDKDENETLETTESLLKDIREELKKQSETA